MYSLTVRTPQGTQYWLFTDRSLAEDHVRVLKCDTELLSISIRALR